MKTKTVIELEPDDLMYLHSLLDDYATVNCNNSNANKKAAARGSIVKNFKHRITEAYELGLKEGAKTNEQ